MSCLVGDDYSLDQIEQWYKEEATVYDNQFDDNTAIERKYPYFALNDYYGKWSEILIEKSSIKALGFGAADASELKPITGVVNEICIVDPAEHLKASELNGKKIKYFTPKSDGKMDFFEDEQFDIITCFGVLMYIPNVTTILEEFLRCLKPGGYLLIREPSTDMNLGRNLKRVGCGVKSRGIPVDFFMDFFSENKVTETKIQHCMFSPWIKLCEKFMNDPPCNKKLIVIIDRFLCKAFAFNYHYTRVRTVDKFSPGTVFVRAKK